MLSANNYNPDVLTCLANLSNDEVFTPPYVANQMLDLLPQELWTDKSARFLDPVSKSGIFLREIAKRLDKGLEHEITDKQQRIDHIFTKQLFGIAITELTALLTRRSLYCSKKANGKYSVSSRFDSEDGNILHRRIEHNWVNGRCSFCGANRQGYDREDGLETHAYEFIHTNEPEGLFNMTFDVIIGNPPYQLSDGGFGTSAAPIYQLFIDQARNLNPRFVCMIVPARWYSGGKGLDEFRDSMLGDNRIREIHDYPDATDVFPGVQIKGGICFFLWNRDERGDCKVVTNTKVTGTSTSVRPLREPDSNIFIRFNEAIPILRKVQQFGEESISSQISSRKPFGLDTLFKGALNPFDGSITLYQNGGIGYCKLSDLGANKELVGKYKVLIPRAGSGSDSFPHAILGKPFLVPPNSACTETYMVAGSFDTAEPAKALISYIQTRLFRFLVLLCKPSQDASSRVYRYVPVQPLIEGISDEKLYQKYGIDAEEQIFIESLIRPAGLIDE
ncbi:MAG: Eco57I restriction-modification methylase domain-containing protein [Chthonomonadales bacterium]